MKRRSIRKLSLFILLLATLVAAGIATVSLWLVDHAVVTEKPINALELGRVEQARTTIVVATTNRGCPAERFIRLKAKRSESRIEIRAYYQTISGVGAPCAERNERHTLVLTDLGQGSYTAFTPTTPKDSTDPIELTFQVT